MNHRNALIERQLWGPDPADFPLVAEIWNRRSRPVRGGLRSRHLPPYISWRFILAQPFIDHLPQQVVFGPGQELDLGDQLGPHPMHALVAEVKFLAWTEDSLLRQVVYEGLREDKPATEVRREMP